MAASGKAGIAGTSGVPPNNNDGTLVLGASPLAGPTGRRVLSHSQRLRTVYHGLRPHKGLPTLRQGVRDGSVRWLQILLNKQEVANPSLKEDGYFGPKTLAAVISFQRRASLSPDGVVGMRTWTEVLVVPIDSPQSTATPAAPPAGMSSPPQDVVRQSLPASAAAPPVADWSLSRRFEEVLNLTPNHMAPEIAAQFRAMLTPLNVGIIVGTLTAWAVSHAFGAGEIADIVMACVGAFFLGMATFTAIEDIGECLMTTLGAESYPDLDRAADYLARAIAILGVVAFFAILAKVGAKFGRAASTAEDDAAGAASTDTSAAPKAKPAAAAADSSAADAAAASTVEQPVYRVDGRPPSTIFNEGFQPRGTSTDLKTYVDTNNPSAFVSTSKTPAIADNPAFAKPGAYLYEVDGTQVEGIDVNSAYPANPYANESEIAVVGGVPPEAIISAKPILPGGGVGPAIPNPGYNGGS